MPLEGQPAFAAHDSAEFHVRERIEAHRPRSRSVEAGFDHGEGPQQADGIGDRVAGSER
jgi:hypothetical protein